MKRLKSGKKALSLLLTFCLVLGLLPGLSLSAHAEAPTPDYYITYDESNNYCAGTTYGAYDISSSDSFADALEVCKTNWGDEGTPVIQLGSTEIPLPVDRGDGTLISATYTGAVNIEYAGSEAVGLAVPSGVTANLQGFTLTNRVQADDSVSYYAINVAGTLNIGDGTDITVSEGTSGTNFMYFAYAVSNSGIVNVSGTASLKVFSKGTVIMNWNGGACTLGGNDGDNISITTSTSGSSLGIDNSGTVHIGDGTNINCRFSLRNNENALAEITGGSLTSENWFTIVNDGTLNMSDGVVSNTGSTHRAIWNSGITDDRYSTAVISGGKVTAAASEAIFTVGSLTLTGSCEVSCTNQYGSAVTSNSNAYAGSGITVDENAKISGNQYGINNSSAGKCPLTIKGGTISSGTASGGGNAVMTDADTTISGGKITSTGPFGCGVMNSGAYTLNITGGEISANGQYATGVSNSTGTVNFSAGSITATTDTENTWACGASNSTFSSTQYGTMNITGGSITARAADSVTHASTMGVQNDGYGVVTISGGTVESMGTDGTSSAVYDELSMIPGGIRIANGDETSPTLKSASPYTVLLQERAADTGAVDYFDTSFYNSDHALVTLRGEHDTGEDRYLINGTNYPDARAFAVPDGGYVFIKWTSDAGRDISDVNETAVSSLSAGGNTSVYLVLGQAPSEYPSGAHFTDTDLDQGSVGGTISWALPSRAEDIDSYDIYWGDATGHILASSPGVLITVSSDSTACTVPSGTHIPGGAACFLIYSHNEAGNSASCAKVSIQDMKDFVTLRSGSLGTAGDQCITGLTSGGYYMVESYAYADGQPVNIPVMYYVKSDGTLSENSSDMGPLTGTVIADEKLLNNNEEYLVSCDRVILEDGSLGTAEDSAVTGLDNGKRYVITNGDETWYSDENGDISSSPSDSAPLYGNTVYGLTNGDIYDVQEYVPTSVVLEEGSLGTAGSGRITGLTSGVKYQIEDETTGIAYYVTAGGTLSEAYGDNAELEGTEITDLTNGDTYNVTCHQVILREGSLGVAGNGMVTGLTPGKQYYMIVEFDGMEVLAFADEFGRPVSEERGMGFLTGDTISNFKNGMTIYVGEYTGEVPLNENYNILGDSFVSGTTLNDWTYHVAGSDGNFKDGNGIEYFDIHENSDVSIGLFTSGDSGETEYLHIDSKSGNPFRLDSFDITNDDGENGTDGYRVVGYLDGSPVDGAEKILSVDEGETVTATFTGAAWSNIDGFRIIPLSGEDETAGLTLCFDNLDVTAAVTDTDAPSVLLLSPQNGGAGVTVDASLALTFSESVTPASGKNLYVKKASDGSTVQTIAADDNEYVTISGGTVTITLLSALEYGSEYYVEIDDGAFEDSAGNAFAGLNGSDAWRFTTAAPDAHAITKAPAVNGGFTVKVGSAEVTQAATGDTVTLAAMPNEGYSFSSWSVYYTIGDDTEIVLVTDDSFIMPAHDVTVEAAFSANPAGTYSVTKLPSEHGSFTVRIGGQESAGAEAGDIVTLEAHPAPGYSHSSWNVYYTIGEDTETISVANSPSASFTMPAYPVTVGASFSENPTDSHHDGDSTPPAPPARTITVTETSSGLFSGSAGGISASANMENAFSDSVEVKVADTRESAAGFGLGAGSEVFPFDISLYIKGTNTKTQPASGYAVTISLPVPDSLLDRKELLSVVHKAENGAVTTLSSRLTQISGVWYLKFEATEFSPYALVVRNTASYDESAGVPYYLDADGSKVFIGFAANGKYIAPDGVTVSVTPNDKSFTDVSGHWAAGYIGFVTEREIFLGTGSNTFSPDAGMTRAMFATVIGRLFERSYGGIEASGAHAFTDCNYGDYYGKYVDWAAKNDIIGGYGNGVFGPDDSITREQMAAILYRFANFLGVLPNDMDAALNYPDAGNISSYAKNAALYCQITGVISGRTGGVFAPKETATRAEVATIIERFVESVVK